jgi:putative ABC transport system permease protein
LIIFVLGSVISGAISVRQAIRNTERNLRKSIPAVVTIDLDHEALMEQESSTGIWPEFSNLTPELLNEIGALPQVKSYDFSAAVSVVSKDVKRFSSDDEMNVDYGMGGFEYFGLKGVHSTKLLDIEEGVIEIASGRNFTEEEVKNLTHVVLISQGFAELNNLDIGSTFTMESIIWDYRPYEGEGGIAITDTFYSVDNALAQQSYDFEVIGIFKSLAEVNSGDKWMDAHIKDEIENRIYIPNPAAIAIQRFETEKNKEMYPDEEHWQQDTDDLMWYQNAYALGDAKEIDGFKEIVQTMIPEFYTVVDMSNSYDGIASSMDSLNGLSSIILWVAVCATVLILSLLITLFLRERKREIGILLALGDRRGKVIMQMMVEVLVVAIIAITLSLFVGSFLSGTLSESMLRNDLVASQKQQYEMGRSWGTLEYMGFSTNMTPDEMIANYDVSLDVTTILTFFAVGIGTVVVATIIPMIYIVRLNPKKIMM